MTREESEAFGLFSEQHSRQIAVTEADPSLIRDGAGDAEALQTDTDRFGGVAGFLAALLDSDRATDGVSPYRVFESDGLNSLYDALNVDTLVEADFSGVLEILDTVFCEALVYLVNSSFVTFKRNCHKSEPPYSLRGSIFLTASLYLP